MFDVKDPALRAALDDAPKIGESLCDDCRAHFAEVRARLDRLGVPYVLDPTLVRGLDYYTRTTFEFMGPEENANSVICGGGRYDGLVEQIGGPPTPGIGFGAGIERLLLALENENVVLAACRCSTCSSSSTVPNLRRRTRFSRSSVAPASPPTWTSPAGR